MSSAGAHHRQIAAGHLASAHRPIKEPAAPYAHYRALAEREAKERGEWPLPEEEICRRAHHLAIARAHQMAAGRAEKAARSARAKANFHKPKPETVDDSLRAEVRRLSDEVGRLAGRLSLLEAQ